jgi:uncharacterized protein YjbJ (UPF0337 family)
MCVLVQATCEAEMNFETGPALMGRANPSKGIDMDKDRIEGSAKQAKGAIKEVAGKVTGDTKLETEGKSDKAAGKVQNAVGGLKDTLRGK